MSSTLSLKIKKRLTSVNKTSWSATRKISRNSEISIWTESKNTKKLRLIASRRRWKSEDCLQLTKIMKSSWPDLSLTMTTSRRFSKKRQKSTRSWLRSVSWCKLTSTTARIVETIFVRNLTLSSREQKAKGNVLLNKKRRSKTKSEKRKFSINRTFKLKLPSKTQKVSIKPSKMNKQSWLWS
jgi:hypothetical protein